MSAIFYDKALVNKIKNWVKDDSITILGAGETADLFAYKADEGGDKPISLPLISIKRNPTLTIQNISKRPLTFDGWRKDVNVDKGTQLNGIPITLTYQIDIYTRHYAESEDYVRSFVFNIINYPKLRIEIPYNNANIVHNSHIRLNPDIQDNSDISERLMPTQFTRKTITIYIDDAYLFDYKTKDTWKLESEVEIADKNSNKMIKRDN